MLRDPRAVIASMLGVGARAAAQGHPTQPWTRSLPDAIAYVQRYFRAARAAAGRRARACAVLHYETLVTQPEAVTRAICGFLGLPWTATMLTPSNRRGTPAKQADVIRHRDLGTTRPRFRARPRSRLGSTGWKEALERGGRRPVIDPGLRRDARG